MGNTGSADNGFIISSSDTDAGILFLPIEIVMITTNRFTNRNSVSILFNKKIQIWSKPHRTTKRLLNDPMIKGEEWKKSAHEYMPNSVETLIHFLAST